VQALFDLLIKFYEELKPFQSVSPWEAGLRVRLGKHVKVVEPGVHLKLPLIDSYHLLNVVPRVVNLPHQSVKTLEGKNLALSGALAYSISDIEKCLVEVDDHDESLSNLAMGLLADFCANHTSLECTHDAIQSAVAASISEMAEQWGIEVSHLYLTDLADVKTFRLLQDHNPPKSPTITIG